MATGLVDLKETAPSLGRAGAEVQREAPEGEGRHNSDVSSQADDPH